MRTFNIKTPDKKIVPALQDKIDNLTCLLYTSDAADEP